MVTLARSAWVRPPRKCSWCDVVIMNAESQALQAYGEETRQVNLFHLGCHTTPCCVVKTRKLGHRLCIPQIFLCEEWVKEVYRVASSSDTHLACLRPCSALRSYSCYLPSVKDSLQLSYRRSRQKEDLHVHLQCFLYKLYFLYLPGSCLSHAVC